MNEYMVVGIGYIRFKIHECYSLKEKRKIVKPIISRIQNRFNVSIAEVGSNDSLHDSEIGFAVIGNDRKVVNSKIDKVFNMAEEIGLAEVVDIQMELMNL